MALSRYTPQLDEPTSFAEGPPPAYTKGYSVKLQLFRLAARTLVFMIALIGTFVLLAAYIRTTSSSCTCPETISRLDPEPLIAEPSTSDFKLHIGEDIRKAKDKRHLDCLVERKQQVLDAIPPRAREAKDHLHVNATVPAEESHSVILHRIFNLLFPLTLGGNMENDTI